MLRHEAAVGSAVSGFWEKVEGLAFRGGFFLQEGRFLFHFLSLPQKVEQKSLGQFNGSA